MGIARGNILDLTRLSETSYWMSFQVFTEFRVDEKVKCGNSVKRADVTVGLSNTAEVLAVT